MVNQEFIDALRAVSDNERFEDMQGEWNFYTFLFEDNRCQTCPYDTDITIIFVHTNNYMRRLILCPICSNRINKLYLTPNLKSILAVRDGTRQRVSKMVIDNAYRIELIDIGTRNIYLRFIENIDLPLEVNEFCMAVNGRLIDHYIRNAFPSIERAEDKLFYRGKENSWIRKLYPNQIHNNNI